MPLERRYHLFYLEGIMILVTGASGHIGNVLAALLYQNGHKDLRLMVRGSGTAHIEPYAREIVRADICDADAVMKAVEGCSDVFHLAASIQMTSARKQRLYDINVGGTRNVVKACLAHGVKRLVHMSSIHALERGDGGVVDETLDVSGCQPTDEYGRTKVLGTGAVLDACEKGLDAVIVYPTGVIGPYDFRKSFSGTMFKKYMTSRSPVHFYFDGGYDFVDVRDVADGIYRAWQYGEKGQGYILAGGRCKIREVIETVGRSAGRSFKMVRMPLFAVRAAAAVVPALCALTGREPILTQDTVDILMSGSQISAAKARERLGYAPRPISESIRDAVQWHMEQTSAV
jgi:dihydroflavonol-4-reductase